jgi:hypothetical protein
VSWMTGVGTPGTDTLSPTTYYALPGKPSTALVGTLAKDAKANVVVFNGTQNVPGRVWLLDSHGGYNNFEATLVYNYTDPKGKNKTIYIPAGAGGAPAWGSADDILTIFVSLIGADLGRTQRKVYFTYPPKPPPLPLP